MIGIDEAIFPIDLFSGRYSREEPEFWESFDICLFGCESGEMILEPTQIREALEASGYRLVLEKIDAKEESQ